MRIRKTTNNKAIPPQERKRMKSFPIKKIIDTLEPREGPQK